MAQRQKFFRIIVAAAVGAVVLGSLFILWIGWAETHPESERELRLAWRQQLDSWFPEAMAPSLREHGMFPRGDGVDRSGALLTVVLVHGLDEPGDIWDDLRPLLLAARTPTGAPLCNVQEFRYPNDQAIDRSASFLAEHWDRLPSATPAVLVGHSMGGLVIREFVSAWRHPVEDSPRVRGAVVRSICLVGTPNHGSEWARLRCWLELRDHFPDAREREFSLFASLRDGVGTAKIDLRPGSEFLDTLNARPWPDRVSVQLIAGRVMNVEQLQGGWAYLRGRVAEESQRERLDHWWTGLDEVLGDGVVTVDSVSLPGAEMLVLDGSHRGLLRRGTLEEGRPPALDPILGWVRGASVVSPR